ncbi:hypothetical protein [Mesorhizobium sp. M0767]|uniref:hypothetical protein n=1 Tax=Mesorhizobium sp. M0767 TaxID=2956995 RepID=UPI0033363630
MLMLGYLATLINRVIAMRGSNGPPVDRPSSTKTPDQNFKTMTLLYRFMTVDTFGVWWKIETRQCPYTGVILRQTKRITD